MDETPRQDDTPSRDESPGQGGAPAPADETPDRVEGSPTAADHAPRRGDGGPGGAGGGAPGPGAGAARRLLEAALFVALVAGASAGAWLLIRTAPEAAEAAGAPPRPIPVETVRLEATTLPRRVEGLGSLEPRREAALGAEVGGVLVHVREGLRAGVRVDAGEELARVDPAPLALEVAAQRTAIELAELARDAATDETSRATEADGLSVRRLELAEAEARRWRDLADRGVASATRVDAAEAALIEARTARSAAARALEAAEAAGRARVAEVRLARERLEVLEDRLARTTIRAPFAGVYAAPPGGRVPSVGDVVAPYGPLGSVLDASELRLVVDVHADDLDAVEVGAAVEVHPSARPGLVLAGRVASLGARVHPRTRAVPVEVLVAPPSAEASPLPAGSFARASIAGAPVEGRVFVDPAWVAGRDGRLAVFAVEEGEGGPRVRAVPVELGPAASGLRALASGPAAGTTIATSSLGLLSDGARIEPRAAEPEGRPIERGAAGGVGTGDGR